MAMSISDREATVREVRRAIIGIQQQEAEGGVPSAMSEALFGILALVNDLADDLQHVRAIS